MLYDLQKVERDKDNLPAIRTDMVTSSGRRLYDRTKELQRRGQQVRIIPQYGPSPMSVEDFNEFR